MWIFLFTRISMFHLPNSPLGQAILLTLLNKIGNQAQVRSRARWHKEEVAVPGFKSCYLSVGTLLSTHRLYLLFNKWQSWKMFWNAEEIGHRFAQCQFIWNVVGDPGWRASLLFKLAFNNSANEGNLAWKTQWQNSGILERSKLRKCDYCQSSISKWKDCGVIIE